MWAPKRREHGAAMVEFSITIVIFFLLVFGIISLCLSFYSWNRLNEAARAGIRYLVVNESLVTLSCPSANTPALTCNNSNCSELMPVLSAKAPFVEVGNVSVSYACSSAGSSSAPNTSLTRSVSLTISGVQNPFGVAALAGFGEESFLSTLPAVSTTRISEDLYTP